MLASTGLFSSMHACVRYLSADLHPFEIAFFRNLFGLAFLMPALLRGRFAILKTDHFNWHLLRASINVFAMLLFFYALSITPLAVVQALSFTAPLFTTVLAALILREKVRARRWAAILIGFAGVMIVLRPGVQSIDTGALMVLGSAAIWAMTMIIIKKLAEHDSPVTITAYVTLLLTPMSLIPALWYWVWPSGTQWLWLAVAGAAGTLGQYCIAKAFAYADATVVLPFDFAKIIWGAALGYLLFGELVSIYTWLGGVVIFSGALYLAYRERQLERLAKQEQST